MSDKFSEEAVPDHCPGPAGDDAGKVSGCAGCPNKKICASGEGKAVDVDLPRIAAALSQVKHIVLVLSGKGGVGKSTLSTQLARAFATDEDCEVGLLDVDLCGPSIPTMTGLGDEQVHASADGWQPVYADDNLAVMSIGFLLASQDDAVIWRGPRKNGLIKQFMRDVSWGKLDYLFVDCPPGTSDEHLSVVQFLAESKPAGAIVVTTPQELALLDVRKEINFCKRINLPVLGVVENMAGFVCGSCHKESIIFPISTGGAEKLCKDMSVPLLGSVPLDMRVTQCCDEGRSIFDHEDVKNSIAAQRIQGIRHSLDKLLSDL